MDEENDVDHRFFLYFLYFSLIEIQWTDAERVLSGLIESLTKKRSEFHDFQHRSRRLITWFENFLQTEMNHRIDGLTLEASLDILKNEIRNLLAEKRRQVNELALMVRVLQTQSNDQAAIQTIKQSLEQLEQTAQRAEEHVEKRFYFSFFNAQKKKKKLFFRIKKTETVMKMLNDFEQGLENIRSWMDKIETKLQKPFSLNILNPNELRNQHENLLVRNHRSFHRLEKKTRSNCFLKRLSKVTSTNTVTISINLCLSVKVC